MQVKLTHRDPAVYPSVKILERFAPVRLGAWSGAELRVSGDQIAKLHVHIEIVGDAVRLRRLAPSMAPVLVNGAAVDEVELQNGDVVRVGNTHLTVDISRQPAPASRDGKIPPLETVAQSLATGLVAFAPANDATTLEAVLDRLAARFSPLLLANFLAAGQEPPAGLTPQADLLAGAPREQIGNHCLYLLAPSDVPAPEPPSPPAPAAADAEQQAAAAIVELMRVFHALRPHEAGVLLFGEADKPAALEAISFRRGFYMSAASLGLFLREGAPELARKLIDGFHAIVVADAGQWTLVANPSLVRTAADLGLETEAAAALSGQ
ncbi:MAG: hypothetical protein IT424_11875 [Pirellulales bacterium]|nr:hypothetical protein [Pirellulales bacterium]